MPFFRSIGLDFGSKLFSHSAVFVGAYFAFGGGSSPSILSSEQSYADARFQDSERDALRYSIVDANERLTAVEEERDLWSSRAASLERDFVRTHQLLEEAETEANISNARVVALEVRLRQLRRSYEQVVIENSLNGLVSEPSLAMVSLDWRENSYGSDVSSEVEDIDMDPGAVEFLPRSAPNREHWPSVSELIELDGSSGSETIEAAVARSHWNATLNEMHDFECADLRGSSLERCEARMDAIDATYGAIALECMESGNARPDYVFGMESTAMPSHAVSLGLGALILCDASLSNVGWEHEHR